MDYVGRVDSDLNERIKHGIGKYKCFKYSYVKALKKHMRRSVKSITTLRLLTIRYIRINQMGLIINALSVVNSRKYMQIYRFR